MKNIILGFRRDHCIHMNLKSKQSNMPNKLAAEVKKFYGVL